MQQGCHEYGDSCSTVIQQAVDVGLPISIVPIVHLGNIKIMCGGDAQVECCGCGDCSGGLELTITQTIIYKIPIEYRTETATGEVMTECRKNFSNTNCSQCRR